MKTYQSHKVVDAAPVARVDQDARIVTVSGDRAELHYQVPENFFGRGAPASGDYLVRYNDGYLSWSPKAAFEEGYSEAKSCEPQRLGEPAKPANLCFGGALAWLKTGARVARTGWNGQGMFAYLVPAASYPVQTGAAKAHFGDGSLVPYRAYLALKTAQNDVATWAPSVGDVLADDWYVVD